MSPADVSGRHVKKNKLSSVDLIRCFSFSGIYSKVNEGVECHNKCVFPSAFPLHRTHTAQRKRTRLFLHEHLCVYPTGAWIVMLDLKKKKRFG